MTTTTTTTQQNTLGDWFDLRKMLVAILTEQGKTEDHIESLVYTATEPVRRYVETIDNLRNTYKRIANSAEQTIAHIDAGYAVYINDALGGDRDRLIQLHTSAEIYRNQVASVRSLLASLDINIDPFDYIANR